MWIMIGRLWLAFLAVLAAFVLWWHSSVPDGAVHRLLTWRGGCSLVVTEVDVGVTADHCVGAHTVVTPYGDIPVKSFSPTGTGFAFVHAPGLRCPCVPMKEWDGEDEAVLVGYPFSAGLEPPVRFVLRGRIYGFSVFNGLRALVVNQTVVPGMSGGGVFVRRWHGGWALVGVIDKGKPGILLAAPAPVDGV